MSTEQVDITTLSFEQAQAELEHVVRKLEDQHTGLDEALALWERGEALHTYCQQKLDYAAERIEALTIDPAKAAEAKAEHDGAFEQASEDAATGGADAEPAPENGTPSMF